MTLRSKFIMLTLGLTTLFSVLMVYDRVRTARNGMLERAEDRAAYIISFITDISAGQLEGEGIPDSFREEIFKKYSGMSKSSKNMGLGLAFCKLVAETHCAEMDVRSAAGKGTEVSFFFLFRAAFPTARSPQLLPGKTNSYCFFAALTSPGPAV
ncbi:MAG: hypothetical protein COX65_04595 [Elusimicrobia bacterium CG_4_10_14_0_2_um_filter_56_8]|nr:MAG: hypothetical protein AUJ51_06370 [Elusimicrobia bacterium CG1_02_56_21]PJA15127.1 MAG: hypothetical protein COX65_04595 [Elusimicrobia bacterium CG_4_10_14_0_2_um_filter_56_8]